VKYTSAIAATASGSIGGATASRNKGGQYFRRRAIPTNPATPRQTVVRNGIATLSSAWSNTLTAVQRAAWAVYGENVPTTDSLGNTIKLSGFGWYTACNQVRISAGKATVAAAPTTFTLATLTIPGVSATAATSLATVTFTGSDGWASAVGGGLVLQFSRPQSTGITFFKGPYQVGFTINGAATPPTSPATGTIPFPVAAGNKVFWQARAFQADGRISGLIRGSFLAS
jgi:hypothetical protein